MTCSSRYLAGPDIRLIINQLQMRRLTKQTFDYDDIKGLSKKDVDMGRGLHSPTSQLRLSRFQHKIHPRHPVTPPKHPRNTPATPPQHPRNTPETPPKHLRNTPLTAPACNPYPTECAQVEPKSG